MKRFIKIAAILILALSLYSLVPVAGLYLKTDPAPYTNELAAEKLENNKGDYFEFIVIGDNHSGFIFHDSTTLKLVWRINREDRFKKVPIDFLVAAGDITYRGSEQDYRMYNKVRSLVKFPVISAAGNHDKDKADLAYFKKYIGENELSFSDRNSYFIILDDTKGELSEEQFAKLEEELKASSAYNHRFIIMHKSPVCHYQQSWYRPELSPWSYRFMKLCERYKVDAVFSGHEHLFKKQAYGGVKYIVSSGGGIISQVPTPDGGYPHYLVVRVYGDYVDYEVRKVFPPFWEYLTYYLWKDVLFFLKDVFF